MSRSDQEGYVDAVVASWTETHKKAALMLFVLLALRERPAWSGELTDYIANLTDGYIAVDPHSLHRSLRRLVGLNLITFIEDPVAGTGAKRKTYELTRTGEEVLSRLARKTLSYARSRRFVGALEAIAAAQS
jgi:DNA-binding PadR family transcriptional regulator